MVKRPGTNRRVSRVNPEAQWITVDVPHLRIVDAATFAVAQKVKSERSHTQYTTARRPKHLLAGLLRCGSCKSAIVVQNLRHAGRSIYCSRRKEGGRCANGHTYRLTEIEHRVLDGLKAQLSDPRDRALPRNVPSRARYGHKPTEPAFQVRLTA